MFQEKGGEFDFLTHLSSHQLLISPSPNSYLTNLLQKPKKLKKMKERKK